MNKLKMFVAKHKKVIMKLVVCFLVISAITGGCTYLNHKVGLEDDNIIEESIEQVIENKTGLDLDLSPASKE